MGETLVELIEEATKLARKPKKGSLKYEVSMLASELGYREHYSRKFYVDIFVPPEERIYYTREREDDVQVLINDCGYVTYLSIEKGDVDNFVKINERKGYKFKHLRKILVGSMVLSAGVAQATGSAALSLLTMVTPTIVGFSVVKYLQVRAKSRFERDYKPYVFEGDEAIKKAFSEEKVKSPSNPQQP